VTSTIDTSPFHKIAGIKVRPKYRLEVHWGDSSSTTVDMESLINEGTAFASLKDPDLFATARIGERHRTVEWPDPLNSKEILVDYSADSLHLRGENQSHSSFLQRLLRELRKRLADTPP
jgi:hypothetical protein